MKKHTRAGVIVLLLLGAGVLWSSHDFIKAPVVGNDSVQYLDAAMHLASGGCFCTNVAHFDEQVAIGHLPIPFTHFAPGYPIVVASLERLGLKPEVAGYVVSAMSYLVTIALFWYLGVSLGVRPLVLGLFGLVWITNYNAILSANAIVTEAPFTMVLLGLAVLIVRDIQGKGNRPLILVGIGIVAGAAYWVRYPGLFVVPVAVLYLFWRWRQDRNTLPWVLVGLASAACECLAIMFRNTLLVGSWRGGFSTGQGHTAKWVLVESLKAFYHLVFGSRVVAHLDIWIVLFACALPAAVALAYFDWRSDKRNQVPARAAMAVAWLLLLSVTYCLGIAYSSLHSIAADLSRYYFPVYPLLLLMVAVVCLARKPLQIAVVTLLVLTVLVIQGRGLILGPDTTTTQTARQALAEEVQPGISVEHWIKSHSSSGDVILATSGQAVYYVVQIPVVSVIEPEASIRKHDEASFQRLMSQFRARYVLLFPGIKAVEEQDAIPFMNGLANGSYPAWLTPAARSTDTVLYECPSCIAAKEQAIPLSHAGH